MAIRGFTGGGSSERKQTTTGGKPGTGKLKQTVGKAGTPAPIKQKIVPTPYSQSPGGSAGTANSVTAFSAANPTNVRTPSGNANEFSGTPMQGAGADFGYTRTGLGQLYQNPIPLAQDVLGGLGVDNYGMAQLLADYFNPALYQFMIQSQGMGDQSDQAVIDYIANAMSQATTPGGASPEFANLMDVLLGASDPNASPLAADLSTLTPEDQVKTMLAYAQAAGFGNNPLAQRAYNRAMDYYGNQYLGSTMKGDPAASNYAEFLRNSPLGGWY